jgi:hypothetical protein
VTSASASAAIPCGAPCGGAVMKRTNKSIESLPQQLSNATLSDGRLLPSVDLNQPDSKTKIAAGGRQTQATVRSKRNRAAFDTLPKEEPRERAQARAWQVLHLRFPDHKIPKKSAAEITEIINSSLRKDRQKVSVSTVQRVLGRTILSCNIASSPPGADLTIAHHLVE